MLHCHHCNSEAVMPKSGVCLGCGAVSKLDNQQVLSSDADGQAPVQHLVTDEAVVASASLDKAPIIDADSQGTSSESESLPMPNATDASEEDAVELAAEPITVEIENDLEDVNVEPLVSASEKRFEPVVELELAATPSSPLEEDASEPRSFVEESLQVDSSPVQEVLVDPKSDYIESVVRTSPAETKLAIGTRIVDFQLVKKKAHLKSDYKKIVNSCQNGLEKLKGELVSGSMGVIRSFMLSSANRSEGFTVSSLAIAIALSQFGKSKVLLIDANAINANLHSLFALQNQPGLVEYISEDQTRPRTYAHHEQVSSIFHAMDLAGVAKPSDHWAKYCFYTEYKDLYIMPYAASLSASSLWDMVEHDAFVARLDQLKQIFDYIVFDTSAILSSSEPSVFSQYVDGVVLVIEAETTKWEVAGLAVSTIKNAGGRFVGAILNKRKFYIPKFLYGWI